MHSTHAQQQGGTQGDALSRLNSGYQGDLSLINKLLSAALRARKDDAQRYKLAAMASHSLLLTDTMISITRCHCYSLLKSSSRTDSWQTWYVHTWAAYLQEWPGVWLVLLFLSYPLVHALWVAVHCLAATHCSPPSNCLLTTHCGHQPTVQGTGANARWACAVTANQHTARDDARVWSGPLEQITPDRCTKIMLRPL